MTKNKIITIFALFLLLGCDYRPIYSIKNIDKNNNFSINSIVFSGENKINQYLKNNLSNYLNLELKKINYDLVINSKHQRKISSKNKKGDPERYISTIIFNIDFYEKDKLKGNKEFKKSYEYNNKSNKYELKTYEQDVKNNLVDGLYENIIDHLNYIQ